MPTIGNFFHYKDFDSSYEAIGLVCQTETGGLHNKTRHVLLAEKRESERYNTFLLSTAPFALQQKTLAYLREVKVSHSDATFPKNNFPLEADSRNNMPMAILFFSHNESTQIKTLAQLESTLQDFLPLSEYQYGSILRIFQYLNGNFESADTPKLSL